MKYIVYTHLNKRTPVAIEECSTLSEAIGVLVEERNLMRQNDMIVDSQIISHRKISWNGGEMYIVTEVKDVNS